MSNVKQIVGIEVVNYTSKKGQQVSGVKLYCCEPLPSPHIGSRAFDVYISGGVVSNYHLGEYVTLIYEPGFSGTFKCTGVLYDNK